MGRCGEKIPNRSCYRRLSGEVAMQIWRIGQGSQIRRHGVLKRCSESKKECPERVSKKSHEDKFRKLYLLCFCCSASSARHLRHFRTQSCVKGNSKNATNILPRPARKRPEKPALTNCRPSSTFGLGVAAALSGAAALHQPMAHRLRIHKREAALLNEAAPHGVRGSPTPNAKHH